MAKIANKPATVATPAPANSAAISTAIANGRIANNVANAHKYGAGAKNIPCAGNAYKLTAGGLAAAQALQAGGKVTVMGMVALAAMQAGATQSNAVNGAAIVLKMRASKLLKAQWGSTRASAKYANGSLPCAAWCSGYVVGAARKAHALLAKA